MKAIRIKIILALVALVLGITVMNFAGSEQRSLGIALVIIGALLFVLNFTRLKNQK